MVRGQQKVHKAYMKKSGVSKKMRMWNVDTSKMCRKHLLGEHLELHMFVGAIKKGNSVQGFINTGLLEPYVLYSRHDELVAEMQKRGYNHQTPLEQLVDFPSLPPGHIDVKGNEIELTRRCKECRFKES